MENFWQTCSAQLELELTPQQYSAWIKPLVALDYEDGKLRIAAPNRFKLDWVKTQFATRITELAAQYWEAPVEVQFVLDPKTNPAAVKFDTLTYDEYLARDLKVADATGIALARDNRMDMVFFNLSTPGTIGRAVRGEKIGTLVSSPA